MIEVADKMQNERVDEFDGCPWRRGKTYGRLPICNLHNEIEDFAAYVSPTPQERIMRLDVLERVTGVILAQWPEATARVFGSYQTGLYLPTSDMDLVVSGAWGKSPLRSLAQALVKNGVCEENVEVIDKALVPIVKMTDKLTGVKMDISFNGKNSVRSAELVQHYMSVYPMLNKLVFVLKQFLAQRNANEVFHGGLSSYSLVLMVVNFLQLHPRGNLNGATVNLGVLLIEFFELYGKKFNYMHDAIRIKDGGKYLSKTEVRKHTVGRHGPNILSIEDPLTPGNDVGRGSYGALQLKTVFEYAFITLKAALNPRVITTPNTSILGRIIRITDKVVLYRAWVEDTFALRSTRGMMSAPADVDGRASGSAAESAMGSKSCTGKLSDFVDQDDRNSNRQPTLQYQSYYSENNDWNSYQQRYRTISPGNHNNSRGEWLTGTSPLPDNHEHHRSENNNYNINYYNHQQNYWPSVGNDHQHATNNHQPRFGNIIPPYRHQQNRKN